MVVRKKMFRDCGRFRTVCLFVTCSAVLVRDIFFTISGYGLFPKCTHGIMDYSDPPPPPPNRASPVRKYGTNPNTFKSVNSYNSSSKHGIVKTQTQFRSNSKLLQATTAAGMSRSLYQFQPLNVRRWTSAFPIDLHWTTFCATRYQCFRKLSAKSSLHLVLGLPRFLVGPRGVQNVMRVVQRLSVLAT